MFSHQIRQPSDATRRSGFSFDSNATNEVINNCKLKELLSRININVIEQIYLKDPESSDLGRRIIRGSIDLIEEMGLERFTFRKLGKAIGSTEASIYRYFENKHKLLLYLVLRYWGWLEYRLVFTLANVEPAEERLRRAIRLLTEQVEEDSTISHINEVKLNKIVIAESAKAYLTPEVDRDNEAGVFAEYKQLIKRVSDIIVEINPNYKYPHMLVSTILEGGHLQRFFAEHLPHITDSVPGEDSIVQFFTDLAFDTIKP